MKTESSTLAINMQSEVISNEQDINNILTTSHNVPPIFHTHYVNMASQAHGIAALIKEILTDNNSTFPANVGSTEFRSIAISSSMFTDDIYNEVQKRFSAGSIRYPKSTIICSLSVFMFKKGLVGKIQLTGKEDVDRPCNRPRCKFFLIQT